MSKNIFTQAEIILHKSSFLLIICVWEKLWTELLKICAPSYFDNERPRMYTNLFFFHT